MAWAWALGLFAATFIVYSSGLETPFLLDDPVNITKSAKIQKPLNWAALYTDARAVVTMSLRFNWITGGADVTGYHVLNIFTHAVTGVLFFLFGWHTLRLPVFGGRYDRHASMLAGVAALLFLLHPIQTESVTYVIQRAEIFAAAALLGALLAFAAMRGGVTPLRLLALVAACLFGVYSKPSFAVLPALLLAYDLAFESRERLGELLQRWPAYLVASFFAVFAFHITRIGGSLASDTAGFGMEDIKAPDYFTAQFGVLVHYLRVTLWPSELCFDCGYRGAWPVQASWLGDSVLVPLGILAALGIGSLLLWRRWPLAAFAVFASAIALAPTSIVPLADFYVEHRMYLPVAFVALALVPAVWEGLRALAERLSMGPDKAAQAGLALALVAVVALSMLTVSRNLLLADPIALMEDSLAVAPQNERVHYNLANALRREGRPEEAIPHYEEAIRLIPNVVRSYQNLGSLYMQQNEVEKAVEVYAAGAKAKPEAAMAHRNLANALMRLNRYDEALEAARMAVKTDAKNATGHRLVGDALRGLGRRDEAIAAYREGLKAAPSDSMLKERLSKMKGG